MKKPDLNIPIHDGTQFDWQGERGTADASDLNDGLGLLSFEGRVWNDSADVGFYVRSHRTGALVLFVQENVQVRDGDTLWWQYTSRGLPAPVSIIVYND